MNSYVDKFYMVIVGINMSFYMYNFLDDFFYCNSFTISSSDQSSSQ
jgi:hypothetical protein